MLRRVFQTALFAGALAGAAATLAQWVGATPLIRAAEVFERADAHGAAEAMSDDPARVFLTLAMNLLVGVGFGLFLAGAFSLSRQTIDLKTGALWGAGGFLAFALLPAFGLPPELPGVPAADLGARQLWWLLAVASSLAGLAALVFAVKRSRVSRIAFILAGGGLLLLPHIVGAPIAPEDASSVPAELAARFAVASLATSLLFWLVLGAASGALYQRSA